jgi:hypothetical protein
MLLAISVNHMHALSNLTFSYAIVFPDGLYYQGPRYRVTDNKGVALPLKKQTRMDDPLHRGPKHQAYTYTEARAYQLIRDNKEVFAGCAVEQVH